MGPGPVGWSGCHGLRPHRLTLVPTRAEAAGFCWGTMAAVRRSCIWLWAGEMGLRQGGPSGDVGVVGRACREAGSCAPGLRLTPCLSPRVYGSYEHLWAGQVADALVDLTGGLAERWNLKDSASRGGPRGAPGSSEPRTCRQLLSLKERCPISCSVFSPRAGEAAVRGPWAPTGTCQA